MKDLFSYKHEDKNIKKNYEIDFERERKIIYPNQDDEIPVDKLIETLEEIETLIKDNETLNNNLKNELNNTEIRGLNKFFDKQILDELDKFHSFLKTLIPSLPPYYYEKEDGEIILSTQAYIDAKDFLLNEFGFNKGNIVDEFDYNGNLNTEKMYFSNDYSVSANGNIYHKDDIVFNINDKSKIFVEYIDLNNNLIKFKPGILVSLDKVAPIDKVKDFFEYNDSVNNNKGIIEFITDKDKLITIIPEDITEEERLVYEEEINNFKGVTLEDLINIFGKDPTESLRKVITSNKNFPEGFQFCNTSHVNYLWLMFLLIIGGGRNGRAPLPQDGSVCGYYEKPQRKSLGFVGSPADGNCSDKKYRTGHNKGYSSTNPQGIKVSLIQMLHSFLSPIFDINMNSLNFEFKVSKWKVKLNLMPSLCIGGTLEHGICKLQEWISGEIRETQGCNSQYIIPKIQDSGEGLILDGIEELKSDSKNANDVEIFYNRNFAILWNYTHYHTKYNNYSEDSRKNEIVTLYSTLNISSKRKMDRNNIEELFNKNYHIIYSDILLDADTGKATNNFENSYKLKLQPSSLTKMFASDTYKNVDVNADPSNVNKIITMGLYASYNCDLIDELDLFEADYSDSEFKPNFIS
ncbi:hypothetical protein VSU16_14920 (plasmid) [Cetobacterium somerae]|uniref:hypothetical protein n=1 Tax=Cetobacterium somerae TaxID=188913 RepID=UPI002E7B53C9|nr:hypothetical protein [Cetobacterium somerae]WVJ03020.1 hypothetical protein VSU16_14920 [Cetobacterium somerae]